MSHFHFPKILTTRTPIEQVDKVSDEVKEYHEAETDDEKDKEAIDVLHAAETFIRIHFRGREDVFTRLVVETIQKNTARGYYERKCY